MYITHSGREIDLENLREEDICLSDISHHLTRICRYGGALSFNSHYSVAKHSIAMTKFGYRDGFNTDVLKILLMHDAAEAYIGDLNPDVKKLIPGYKDLETRITGIINTKYNLPLERWIQRIVKQVDTRIILDEAKALFHPQYYNSFEKQTDGLKPLGIRFTPIENMYETYDTFLTMCYELDIKD